MAATEIRENLQRRADQDDDLVNDPEAFAQLIATPSGLAELRVRLLKANIDRRQATDAIDRLLAVIAAEREPSDVLNTAFADPDSLQ